MTPIEALINAIRPRIAYARAVGDRQTVEALYAILRSLYLKEG